MTIGEDTNFAETPARGLPLGGPSRRDPAYRRAPAYGLAGARPPVPGFPAWPQPSAWSCSAVAAGTAAVAHHSLPGPPPRAASGRPAGPKIAFTQM